MTKHRLPTVLELQSWAMDQRTKGRWGIRTARNAARIWASLGHPEFAEAILSGL